MVGMVGRPQLASRAALTSGILVRMRIVVVGVLFVVSACASGSGEDDPTRRRDGSAGRDAQTSDVPAMSCVPMCAPGAECVSGRCVMPGEDRDGDGIPAEIDCDDDDPEVGTEAERTCTSACGVGSESCTAGVWSACSAPLTCDCAPGTPPREASCGTCGTRTQECVEGMWLDVSECSGGGACMPGEIARETRSCGACNRGTQERTRSCGASCEWGEWGGWSACSEPGVNECTAGAVDTEERACGNCNLGRQSRTRTCSSSCEWGAWGSYGTCSGGGVCQTGQTRSCPDRTSPCTEQVCTASCTWSACRLRTGAACDHVSDSGVAGGRWRCCPSGGRNWQFCLSSCQWSTACESCSCSCP